MIRRIFNQTPNGTLTSLGGFFIGFAVVALLLGRFDGALLAAIAALIQFGLVILIAIKGAHFGGSKETSNE